MSGITTCTATVAIGLTPVVAARAGLSVVAWIGIALCALVLVLAVAVVIVRYALRHRTMTV